MRSLTLGGACLALSACDETLQFPDLATMSLAGGREDATTEGIRTLSLLGGAARARGPDGYCVDQGASRSSDGFAVMVGCALLAPEAAVMPAKDGFITVQFGETGTATVAGSEETLRAFLETDAGKRVLAGTGEGDDVTLHNVDMVAGTVTVHFTDQSAGNDAGLEPRLWQGFFDVNGRLTTVTVRSFSRNPLAPRQGAALLDATIREIRAVNPPIPPQEG
ncbi:hypothetical protein [Octadecabacter sp. R77987]|uniref:hypothetical protein n=1 Tax=Octadecabacter sp. R77987 TaxID=3093874 RepID=UPI00366D0C05